MSDRPELAVREGYSPPRDLPQGDFEITHHPDGGITVDRADPRVMISGELLALIDHGECCPGLQLEGRSLADHCCVPKYVGALLRINAANRNVVYRITERVPEVNGYIGEWPE